MIVFCQAPADIPYVLSLYEKYKNEEIISIVVINVENVFKFIKSLNLDLDSLVFIPYALKSFKSPLDIIRERKRIIKLNKKYFDSIADTNVYFFSRFEDWLTSFFLKGLSKRNKIYYLDHYDFSSEFFEKKKLTFKLSIYKLIYFLLTGVDFKLEIIEKIPELNYGKYKIERRVPQVNNEVFQKYQYEIDILQKIEPIVLFFVMPCEPTIYNCESHDEIQLSIVESFKKNNWTVVIKGHPRLGVPENIMNVVDVEIPSYIPAEFLQIKDVKMCVGIITTALAHFATSSDIKTYSLVNLFQFRKNTSSKLYTDYLSEASNNQVKFFQSFNDFENNIKN
ncbi:hypothetical protein [Flavobacterium sp. Root186]|uniref:hypothetical protein n=1 Tax=Flavobacterium sp. Root186 TaxID=1736485 RepID=UPI0006F8AE37|nr:hypothetical protein [Flavobacterium sp. Root186]KRB57291.1 hypothetical protein ASD98_03115 [Flavobacterium sp. Root186]